MTLTPEFIPRDSTLQADEETKKERTRRKYFHFVH
jgi:hypothetical protein